MNSEDSCNSSVTGIQLSSEENDVHALTEQLPQILQQNPDIVLIELGMNDHCVEKERNRSAVIASGKESNLQWTLFWRMELMWF